jgi:hypothetical protein
MEKANAQVKTRANTSFAQVKRAIDENTRHSGWNSLQGSRFTYLNTPLFYRWKGDHARDLYAPVF